MCGNFPNIKVVEGNAFSVLIPLKVRTFESCKPIDEDIDPLRLTNVVFKFGGVEYTPVVDARGVSAVLPATLARGSYDIVLTADYCDNAIRAAYESAVTIVAWNSQSDAQQYIQGSPIAVAPAYVIGGPMTDAELEALKEQLREDIAATEQAKADAEEAKREWEQKAAQLDDVAQESTLTQGVQDIRDDIRNIDTSDLAKQGTNPNATLSEVQAEIDATSQQILTKATSAATYAQAAATAAGQAKTAAQAAQTAAEALPTIADMRAAGLIQVSYDGATLDVPTPINSIMSAIALRANITKIVDNITEELTTNYASWGTTSLQEVEFNRLYKVPSQFLQYAPVYRVSMPAAVAMQDTTKTQWFRSCTNLRFLNLQNFNGIDTQVYLFYDCKNLIDIICGAGFNSNVNMFSSGAQYNPVFALDNSASDLVTDSVDELGRTINSNLDQWLYNMRRHAAANLPQLTNEGYSISFNSAPKAAILADQPTADAFTNKGWTIA